MNWGAIDAGWYWVAAAAVLALTELAVPGIFLVWIAAAAVIAGVVAFATGVSLQTQLVVFGISSIVMVLIARRSQAKMAQTSSDPLLNDRAARLIGQSVTVLDAIENGEGRVKVGDSVWSARGEDAPAGKRVRVIGIEGGALLVVPTEAAPAIPHA